MFNITSLQADGDNNICTIGWSYTIAAGSRSGQIALPDSVGPIPASTASKADLLNYLNLLLPEGVTESLDAQIAKDNIAAEIHEVAVPS